MKFTSIKNLLPALEKEKLMQPATAARLSLVGIPFLVVVLTTMGLRINLDHSIPTGIWWEFEGDINKGAYVLIDFEAVSELGYERGYSGGPAYLGKKIVGTPGDSISITDRGVFINDFLMPNSKPFSMDGENRPMPVVRKNFIVEDGGLFVLGDHIGSFDSRYFGTISKKAVKTNIKPVFTF